MKLKTGIKAEICWPIMLDSSRLNNAAAAWLAISTAPLRLIANTASGKLLSREINSVLCRSIGMNWILRTSFTPGMRRISAISSLKVSKSISGQLR
ncbi:Uncharacterised protein [Vibrio cholerae]|nr:Uncharacterised protein [Vibrio cholerae]CSB65157.1 Uncharacterised protein [Vibrio cholerae]CSI49102.1 Uncharacterised protein [Vibrio cholerae]